MSIGVLITNQTQNLTIHENKINIDMEKINGGAKNPTGKNNKFVETVTGEACDGTRWVIQRIPVYGGVSAGTIVTYVILRALHVL